MGRLDIIAIATAVGTAVGAASKALYDYLTAKSQSEHEAQEVMFQRLWSRIDNLEQQIDDLRDKVDQYQDLYHEAKRELGLVRERAEQHLERAEHLEQLNAALERENEKLSERTA